MPIERQEGRPPKRPPIEAWRERRSQLGESLSKSRYKLYDRPQKSTFATALDSIKRERDPEASTSKAVPKRTVQIRLEHRSKELPRIRVASPSQPRPSFIREDSSVNITKRKSQHFKDVFSEYMKKRALTVGPVPRRIRIIKLYVPRNLDEALAASIKRFKPPKKIDNAWREPRLQWLEKLELESDTPPKTLPDDSDDECFTNCFLWLYPFSRQRRKANK